MAQEVHTEVDVQVRQLLRKVLQVEHKELDKVYPELQTHVEPLKLKYPAVLQVEHTVFDEHVKHPAIKDTQV